MIPDAHPGRISHALNHARASTIVLRRLMAAKGNIVTYEALEAAIWGANATEDGPRSARKKLDPCMCKLRKRLPPGAIQTIQGIGYRINPDMPGLPQIDDALVVLAARTPEDEAAFRAIAEGPRITGDGA